LAAWAITTDGRKGLLHLAVGNKESEACWTEFLRNMVSRGLGAPLSVTSDGAPAIAQVFPQACASDVGTTGWQTSAPSSPPTTPPRCAPTCAQFESRHLRRRLCHGRTRDGDLL
jgi:hypothetical protein